VSAAGAGNGKEAGKPAGSGKSRTYVKQTDVPKHSLREALRVAEAISEHYAKQPTKPLDVAFALDLAPNAKAFEYLLGASIAYGLTQGGPQADQISLTDLGRRIVAPTKEGEDLAAQREAFQRPRVIREFLTKHNNGAVPRDDIARNVLEGMGVPPGSTERALRLIIDNASDLGLIKKAKNGRYYVSLNAPAPASAEPAVGPLDTLSRDEDETDEEREDDIVDEVAGGQTDDRQRAVTESRPGAIFLGHGKKRGPLEKLQKILDKFKVPHRVAVDQPNLGRPIPQKVKDIMEECNSAILIFTKDEEFRDAEGNELWRPSENVVYELGAASFAYEDRVVILKEKGITFPTNFSSVGHIEFDEDGIEAKAVDILMELIGFKLVTVNPA